MIIYIDLINLIDWFYINQLLIDNFFISYLLINDWFLIDQSLINDWGGLFSEFPYCKYYPPPYVGFWGGIERLIIYKVIISSLKLFLCFCFDGFDWRSMKELWSSLDHSSSSVTSVMDHNYRVSFGALRTPEFRLSGVPGPPGPPPGPPGLGGPPPGPPTLPGGWILQTCNFPGFCRNGNLWDSSRELYQIPTEFSTPPVKIPPELAYY